MSDIVIRQSEASNITIAANATSQVVVQQSQPIAVTVLTSTTPYLLPAATNTTLGGIIVGENLSINANGLLSAQNGMTEIANVTYGVTAIPKLIGTIPSRWIAGFKSNQTSASFNNSTILTESYSGLTYNQATGLASATVSGITKTYSDPTAAFGKEQSEIGPAVIRYAASDPSGATILRAGFNVGSLGGAQLYFTDVETGSTTTMQVDSSGVYMQIDNGTASVNGDEILTIGVACQTFAPLRYK